MTIIYPKNLSQVKGFINPEEGIALAEAAYEACGERPALEIGSYCGKSTLYLAAGCKPRGSVVFAVDHHRGSEEHQPGEEYHDASLYDEKQAAMDTFREFRRNIDQVSVGDCIVPIVAPSEQVARQWQTPLGLLFIDGGHSETAAQIDYQSWSRHVAPGGILAIHDLFPDPAKGGQAPINIWRRALATGLFEKVTIVTTLGILRRNYN